MHVAVHAASQRRASWIVEQPYAHRGLWTAGLVPENSLAAFAAAARIGLGVELDVRISADGDAVVFHDSTLERMTRQRGATSSRTAAELAEFELIGSRERIPLLTDALALLKDTPTLVELKVNAGVEGPLERRVTAILEEHKGPAAVMSFNPATLTEMSRLSPETPRGLLCEAWRRAPLFPWSRRAAVRAFVAANGASFGPEPDFLACETGALKHFGRPAAEAMRTPLLAWTVRTKAQLERARLHADGVIFEALEPGLVRGQEEQLALV
ncbi:MAG: hypothetical protein JNJ73_09305 [Hyphomonadaceae bacterium]|nr:hypothetical protein [Hyphomonadaceae bacterium]